MDKDLISIESSLGTIKLIRSESRHYAPLLAWVSDAHMFTQWAGPSLTRAKSADELEVSLQVGNYQSFSLVKDEDVGEQLIGFGQIQIWSSRVHLGRLIIAPQYRNMGLSYKLVNALIEQAAGQVNINSVSLFVYDNNKAAKTSYKNLGFVAAAYPKGIKHIENCTFMTLDY